MGALDPKLAMKEWESAFWEQEQHRDEFVWASLRRVMAGEAPYSVHVEESECAGGGDGVFVEGRAEEGEVLAVYRGVVYDPTSVESMHSFICPDNEYLLFRRDTVLLDGRNAGASGRIWETCLMREAAAAGLTAEEAKQKVDANPWACGQLVNHPPAGHSPNVRATAINVGAEGDSVLGIIGPAPPETLEWLRWTNLKFQPSQTPEDAPVMHTVLLRAARAVEDEELFLDYKISAELRGQPLPPWYNPVVACPFNEMGVAMPRQLARVEQ